MSGGVDGGTDGGDVKVSIYAPCDEGGGAIYLYCSYRIQRSKESTTEEDLDL